MKKIYFALLCMAGLLVGTACGGDKKADNEKEKAQETEVNADEEEVTEEEADNQADEQEKKDVKRAELQFTIEEEVPAELQAIYANGDFKPCMAVFFKDDLKGEPEGECPSKWDLNHGTAEVKQWKGEPAIFLSNDDTEITPIVGGEEKNYLSEVFTLDFDYFCNDILEGDENDFNACYHLHFYVGDDDYLGELTIVTEDKVGWNLRKTNEEYLSGENPIGEFEKTNDWNHVSISFNKDVMKVYVNGHRVANLPKLTAPGYFSVKGEGWDDHRYYIKNFRLATNAPEE